MFLLPRDSEQTSYTRDLLNIQEKRAQMYKNNSIHYKLARRETGLKEVEEEKVAKRYEKNDGLRRTSDGNADKVAGVPTGRRRVEQGLDEVPDTEQNFGARHWVAGCQALGGARHRVAGCAGDGVRRVAQVAKLAFSATVIFSISAIL